MTDETTTLEDRDEEIVDMLQTGTHTLEGIGDLFGVSKQRIRQIGDRYGVTNQRNAVRRAEAQLEKEIRQELRAEKQEQKELLRAKVIRLRESDMTYKEVAKEAFNDEKLWRRAQEICLGQGPNSAQEVTPDNTRRDGNIYDLFLKGSDEDMLVEGTGLSLASIKWILKKEKKKAEEKTVSA